jgi:uncharacterized membrane protein
MSTPTPPPYTAANTVAWALWGALAVIYHVVFVARALQGWRSGLSHRGGWVAKMVALQGGEIAVVQALRNTLIAATFAAVLAYTYADSACNRIAATRASDGFDLLQTRDLVLAIVLFISFVNFFLTIRCAVFVGYVVSTMQPVMQHRQQQQRGERVGRAGAPSAATSSTTGTGDQPAGDIELAAPPPGAAVAVALNSAATLAAIASCEAHFSQMSIHFSLGLRAFYLAVPVVLLAAGPIVFIVASLLVFTGLVYIDANGIS